MDVKTFLLSLNSVHSIEVYGWCSEQFGDEFKNWKYVYGTVYHQFVIQGTENIVLFKLTWHEFIKQDI